MDDNSDNAELDDDLLDDEPEELPYHIVTLNYVSLYLHTLAEAVAFYTEVFGPPESVDTDQEIYGWRMGATWLTLLPSRDGTGPEHNPTNAEFAVQVSAAEEVDALYAALIEAGAQPLMPPADTKMYERMRYGCVDDPFGVRIDVYYPTPGDGPAMPPQSSAV